MRLLEHPTAGKVRVCNECASSISDVQATGVEEDLAVNTEIIKHIQRALKRMHEQVDASKIVLLELDAEASDDRSTLEGYLQDPEGDAYSFSRLRGRAQQQWSRLQLSLEQQLSKRSELADRTELARTRLAEQVAAEQELLSKKSELDVQLGAMDRALAERDGLVRRDRDLESAVAAARAEVQELEQERRERQEASRGRSQQPSSSSAAGSSQITISTGRQDPLIPNHSFQERVEGCRRRACAVM